MHFLRVNKRYTVAGPLRLTWQEEKPIRMQCIAAWVPFFSSFSPSATQTRWKEKRVG